MLYKHAYTHRYTHIDTYLNMEMVLMEYMFMCQFRELTTTVLIHPLGCFFLLLPFLEVFLKDLSTIQVINLGETCVF